MMKPIQKPKDLAATATATGIKRLSKSFKGKASIIVVNKASTAEETKSLLQGKKQ